MFSLFTLEQRSKKSVITNITFNRLNGLRILSKRSLNDRAGHAGPATVGRSLRSLGSKSSPNSLFCVAIASDIKADL